MAVWVAVCRLDEIADGKGRSVEAAGLPVAILRAGASVFALYGRCPHSGGPLGHGWVEEAEVICPLHHWRFKLSDGRCTTMRGEGVHRFRCEVREGEVWVEV
jgi:NAD(P)H-dependent nitrite reductase small subunit